MKISVVMCTYNGEKYIKEQLHTIYRQSRKPDEVLIIDDHSTDRTVSIIKDYIHTHHLQSRWHLYENTENVGWKRNFMDAFRLAKGDLIFLADQDDVWHRRKIELMADVCKKQKQIHLLVCDCFPFDDKTGKRKKWFLPELGKKELNKVEIFRSFADCYRPGCTYALRSCMKDYIDGLWKEEWPHDMFFWCLALAQGKLYRYRKVLVKWRRAEGNSTPGNAKTKEGRREVLERQYDVTEQLLTHRSELHITENKQMHMYRALRFYKNRAEAIENGNLLRIVAMFRYIRLYPKNSTWIGDLLSVMR